MASALLSGCALLKLATKGNSWPKLSGEISAPVAERVFIRRDGHGTPHIRANSERDAWFALGFVHGQDRLFQADVQRRLMWGRLSEWLGDRTVGLDLFMAGLQLRERGERIVNAASPEVRDMLEAYSEGMNAGADSLGALPIEYRLVGAEFEPWTPVDCAAVVFLQSWGLNENAHFESTALMLRDLKTEELDQLFRLPPDPLPVDPAWEEIRKLDIAGFSKGFQAFTDVLGGLPERGQASNNWVVGGQRTADGLPIVANDPHLGQSVPSLWYVVDLQGGELHVAGVSFAGSPTVVIGHNESVAWGLTNVMADYVDYAVLERVGDDGYVLDGGEKTLRRVEVEVSVKDGEPATSETWWTEVGPVITDLEGTHIVAMRWHAFELADQTAGAFRALNLAGSVQQGLDVMKVPMTVAQNLVIADVHGDYAWQQVGSIPTRAHHTGRVPYLASELDSGWTGWWDELPGERNPERGYVWTANAAPADARAAAISTGYAPTWRHDRIAELLDGTEEATVADMGIVQRDLYARQAATLLPGLLDGHVAADPRSEMCRSVLEDWDFQVTSSSPGPLVWTVFQREFLRASLEDDLGPEVFDVYLQAAGATSNLIAGDLSPWLDDRPAAVERALIATCDLLQGSIGNDPDDWSWGGQHLLELDHPFASGRKLLSKWNMPSTPFQGNGATVAATSHGWRSLDMPVAGMPSMRIVMPLGDLGASTVVHPGGQSGQPRAKFFTSHFDAFVGGKTLPLWFSEADVAANTAYSLTLEPQ